jgi:aspartate-semialdehyde dehydrogenase
MTRAGYRIAVVGATGAVGQTVLTVLQERSFPVAALVPFASERSGDRRVDFGGQEIECQLLSEDVIQGFDIVISSAGGSVSEEWVPKFAATGALVIDKSSWGRTLPGIPLVVAGVNDEKLEDVRAEPYANIVASPNCSTMQLVVALKPILDEVGLEEVVVSTYQSVSGTGQRALDELDEQIQADLDGRPIRAEVYAHPIAFNALPQVEEFDSDPDFQGYTTEESKIIKETRRILERPDLPISPTCVRVPVRKGHSEAVRVRTARPLSAEDCRALLRQTPGIQVVDDPAQQLYPLATQAADNDDVFVGRIRNDLGPNGDRCLNLWIVGDNLRKGAATNAVQIAEELDRREMIGAPREATVAPEERPLGVGSSNGQSALSAGSRR